MLNYKLKPISLLKVKTELKNHICNRFYGISCEGPVLMERVLKKCLYQHFGQLGNFFQIFFSISRNFTKYYLHAKFQINWTIQTEIRGGAESALPRPYQSAKSPACLGLTGYHTEACSQPVWRLCRVLISAFIWHVIGDQDH